MISVKLAEKFGVTNNLEFIISAIVAALTVGGKAIRKRNSSKKININSIWLWKSSKPNKRRKQIEKWR